MAVDWHGFDRKGVNKDGYDRAGFNRQGRNKHGETSRQIDSQVLSAIYQRYEELWEKGYWEPPPVPLNVNRWMEVLGVDRDAIGRGGGGVSISTYNSDVSEAEEPPSKRQRKTGRYLAAKEAERLMQVSRDADRGI